MGELELAALRRGEASAFAAVYERYGPRIYSFLRRMARRSHVADDLFQETWLALARHAPTLRDDTDLEAWLFTVARNAFRSYRRWELLDVSRWLERSADELGAAHDAEGRADAARTVAELERALGRLKPPSREVLLLVAVQGMEQERVAAVLGVSYDSVRQRLSRARKELEQEIARGREPAGRAVARPATRPTGKVG